MGVWVWSCEAAGQGTATNINGNRYPTCTNGGGSWIELDVYTAPTFDVSQLDPQQLAEAFGAGFVTVGVGLVTVFAARLVLESIRTRF